MRNLIIVVLIALFTSSCSEYQKLLKSNDYDLQYTRAMEYYEAGDYMRASTLFGGLISIFRGTERSEISHYIYADCLFRMRNYLMAAHHFRMFVQNYPTSDRAEDAQFMAAYCHYKLSPNPRLDQTDTYQALEGFQLFINLYPNSERVVEATQLMDELRDKLVYKAYLNAKLYFNLGTYMGNNYQSAVIAARNTLDDFPDTKHREELSFLILDAKYIQAVNSIEERMQERLRETIDEYYTFINEFPNSQYIRRAHRIFEETSSLLN
ncbi:outer membrane protein assembly factor BamD [Alkalitalea saponilacus]|uniref:Outer membrane protein assembly factor BamD n=1 Tax=Alkalitalea saponilacus TaxID=889453 RepID=A0A1T5FC76_9BACT|nr:outer membrane protein assembly factor BamD [Alkalitalea saponilacus]ASB50079.1 outer membrane protein assembly factor BamD [Alkalitalea saponilacus]SKB93783.1 outer membrane protein assembly factor BamD [Alkalitalea saponilacus]